MNDQELLEEKQNEINHMRRKFAEIKAHALVLKKSAVGNKSDTARIALLTIFEICDCIQEV